MKINQNEQNKLIQQFDNAILSKKHNEAIQLGEELLKVENLKTDIKQFVQTNLPIAYHNQGLTYYDMGKYQEALSAYTKALSFPLKNKQKVEVYQKQGDVYYTIGSYEAASLKYTQALKCNPDNETKANIYNSLGVTYYNISNYKEALSYYNQALELDPKHADAYYNRGNTYYNMDKYEEALSDYNKALELDTKHAYAYYNRGLTHQAMGNQNLAERDFKRARELNPALKDLISKNQGLQEQLDLSRHFENKVENYSINARNWLGGVGAIGTMLFGLGVSNFWLNDPLKLFPLTALGVAGLWFSISQYRYAKKMSANMQNRALVARTYPEFLERLDKDDKSSRQGVVALVMTNLFAQNQVDVKGDLPMVEILKVLKPVVKESNETNSEKKSL